MASGIGIQYITDTFGQIVGTEKQKGIVDVVSPEQVDTDGGQPDRPTTTGGSDIVVLLKLYAVGATKVILS